MTEYEILEAISLGNQAAFKDLYHSYRGRVFNTCLYYLHNIEEAEEAVQDVFLEIYDAAGTFGRNATVSTWVYRISVNKCLDRLRHRKRKKRYAKITSLFHAETGTPQTEIPDFIHPGVLLENRELSSILFSAISRLPENQKTAFILKQAEGLPQKEVSMIMNISQKAVESLLQRAKTNLRKLLSDYYDSTEGKPGK